MTLHSSRPDARTDLLHGTLDMLILRTLQWGPQHGYAIGQTIRAQSCDVLQVEAGSLYPALQRLARKRWVTAKSASRKPPLRRQRDRCCDVCARGGVRSEPCDGRDDRSRLARGAHQSAERAAPSIV